jgi:hypothetical protein
LQDSNDQIKTSEYIEKIRKQGINLKSNEEGIQRRLQFERIKNIASKVFGDKVEDWFGSKRKERFIEIGLKL